MRFRILQHGTTAVALFLASVGVARCGGSSAVSAPTPPFGAAPAPGPPTRLQPTVTRVRPNVVSTSGSWGTITGTQFDPGAKVKIGGAVMTTYFMRSTELYFGPTGPHDVGTVSVTVTNPSGLSATLPASYTFATPDTFDFNGDWIAHAGATQDYMIDMRFTIRHDVLVSVSCGLNATLTVPTPLQIVDGSFSLAGDGGLKFLGTLDSIETSNGKINAPECGDGLWWADKAESSR